MQQNIGWIIGEHGCRFVASETPVLERGSTISVDALFVPRDGTTFADGTLFADGTVFGDYLGAYRALRRRLTYTGGVRTGVTDRGVPWIRERLPERAPVDTQIVLVQPMDDFSDDIESFWAALVGGSDSTLPVDDETARSLTLELFVLAGGDDYDDADELRDDLGSDVL